MEIWQKILRFWPIIVVGLMVLIAGAETRYQVAQLVADRRVDIEQWKLLRSQGHKIVDHERRLQGAEQHMTPAAIQAWGAVQQTVREDHQALMDHLRRHP
jgi:hypothetical protein